MSTEIKARHKVRFDGWSHVYDRSILQRLVFNISHDMFFAEMMPILKDGAEVLDVGCGTGKFSLKLHSYNSNMRIHGVDLSDDMITKAKAKVKDNSIEFRTGDVENLPYDDNSFDVVTCSHSFHHYPNQKRALAEMRRVLKPGGKAMIVDGSRDNLWGNIIFGIVEIVEREVYHIFEKELREMLQSVGFTNITQKTFNPIAPLLFTVAEAKK
jgi:ubiquinone/menaquinone biosynthesis C-methylase UbiE